MYFGASSVTNTSLMKLWNSPSALNNIQIVEEGQYGDTSIAFAEYFDDVKCLIVFKIKYTEGTYKLFLFDKSTGNVFTSSGPGYLYLELNFWPFFIGIRSNSIYWYLTPFVC